MSTEIKPPPTIKLTPEEIMHRFRLGVEMAAIKADTTSADQWQKYNAFCEKEHINASERSKYLGIGQIFGDPAFVQRLFEHPTFAEAILKRRYNADIDTPERLISLLTTVVHIPFNTLITLGQQSVLDEDRILVTRLILLGILSPNTDFIRRLFKGTLSKEKYSWQVWLAQHSDNPTKPGSIPDVFQQGYQNIVPHPGTQDSALIEAILPTNSETYYTGAIDIRTLLQQITSYLSRNTHLLAQIEQLEQENIALKNQVQIIQNRELYVAKKATYYEERMKTILQHAYLFFETQKEAQKNFLAVLPLNEAFDIFQGKEE